MAAPALLPLIARFASLAGRAGATRAAASGGARALATGSTRASSMRAAAVAGRATAGRSAAAATGRTAGQATATQARTGLRRQLFAKNLVDAPGGASSMERWAPWKRLYRSAKLAKGLKGGLPDEMDPADPESEQRTERPGPGFDPSQGTILSSDRGGQEQLDSYSPPDADARTPTTVGDVKKFGLPPSPAPGEVGTASTRAIFRKMRGRTLANSRLASAIPTKPGGLRHLKPGSDPSDGDWDTDREEILDRDTAHTLERPDSEEPDETVSTDGPTEITVEAPDIELGPEPDPGPPPPPEPPEPPEPTPIPPPPPVPPPPPHPPVPPPPPDDDDEDIELGPEPDPGPEPLPEPPPIPPPPPPVPPPPPEPRGFWERSRHAADTGAGERRQEMEEEPSFFERLHGREVDREEKRDERLEKMKGLSKSEQDELADAGESAPEIRRRAAAAREEQLDAIDDETDKRERLDSAFGKLGQSLQSLTSPKGIAGFVGKIIAAGIAIHDWSEALLASQEKLGLYSGQISASMGMLERQALSLNIAQARGTEKSFSMLADEIAEMRANTQPIEELATNVKNILGVGLLKVTNSFTRYLKPIAEMLQEWFDWAVDSEENKSDTNRELLNNFMQGNVRDPRNPNNLRDDLHR